MNMNINIFRTCFVQCSKGEELRRESDRDYFQKSSELKFEGGFPHRESHECKQDPNYGRYLISWSRLAKTNHSTNFKSDVMPSGFSAIAIEPCF
jgi:hypothetical protein